MGAGGAGLGWEVVGEVATPEWEDDEGVLKNLDLRSFIYLPFLRVMALGFSLGLIMV